MWYQFLYTTLSKLAQQVTWLIIEIYYRMHREYLIRFSGGKGPNINW